VAPGGIRVFVALELAEDVRRRIGELVSRLRPRMPEVRWVRPDGLHLTLRFLGDATAEQVEGVGAALEGAAAACPVSEAAIRGLGVFPDRGQPRILWLGLEVAPSVMALQLACERAAVEAGFAPERRAFKPHLTLGRWRERARRPDLPAEDLGSASLDTVTLFRSELRPGGALYTPLRRLTLEPRP
jgi:2'-5' RNA ligase